MFAQTFENCLTDLRFIRKQELLRIIIHWRSADMLLFFYWSPLNTLHHKQHATQNQTDWQSNNHISKNEKALRETQTLHAGCSKVEPKFLALPQTPFAVPRDGQNLVNWRWSLPIPTNPVWWGSIHTISSYHGNRPQTHTTIDRTDYNTLRRS